MGWNCALFEFHYDRYCDCVVPAVQRLLADGVPGPWLEAVRDVCWPPEYGPRDPRLCPSWNLPDLPPGTQRIFLDDCLAYSATPTCTFVRGGCWECEQFFLGAIAVACLGPNCWIGKRREPFDLCGDIEDLAEEIGETEVDWLEPLLVQLSNRGRGWWADSDVGIRGWLCAEETQRLAELMSRCLTAGDSPRPVLAELQMAADPVLENMRALLCSAAASGQGVLFGKDLSSDVAARGVVHGRRFLPAWRTPTVLAVARGIEERAEFEALPILADALEEAGCDNAVLLAHCREPGDHVYGCWVLDLILAKGD